MLKKLIIRTIQNPLVFRIFETLSWLRHRKAILAQAAQGELKLHLGSGRELLPGWVNADGRLGRGILSMYFPRGLRRFPDRSARLIYSSHFLEHLEYPDTVLAFLRECHRVLVPGGTIRIVVPGIEKIIRAYVEGDEGFFAVQAEQHPAWCKSRLDHLIYPLQMEGRHKYGYDIETLGNVLVEAGFHDVVDSDHNQSRIEELRVDYRGGRDNHGRYLSLFAEATA